MIISTQFLPVSGKVHSGNILCEPFLAACSIVTTTLVRGADTRSIAPPIPFTILPWKFERVCIAKYYLIFKNYCIRIFDCLSLNHLKIMCSFENGHLMYVLPKDNRI